MELRGVVEKLRGLADCCGFGDLECYEVSIQGGKIYIDLPFADFFNAARAGLGTCTGFIEENHLVLETRWYITDIGDVLFRTSLYP